jgi:hypothetical protein
VPVAGGPTQVGTAYPSDELLAIAVLEHAKKAALAPRSIDRVFLHIWADEAVHELYRRR